MDYTVCGQLTFNEQLGKFCVVDVEKEEYLGTMEFGKQFQVLENGNWVDTELAIGSNDKGEMIFVLKNTGYKEVLEGLDVRY